MARESVPTSAVAEAGGMRVARSSGLRNRERKMTAGQPLDFPLQTTRRDAPMGTAVRRSRARMRLHAATLAFLLFALPGLRSVQAGSRPCAMHRASQLRCHENGRDASGHSTARRECCRKGHGLSAAFCGCGHKADAARVSSDPCVPIEVSAHRILLGSAAFRAVTPQSHARNVDPPDPPPPIGSSPPLS